MQNIGHAHSAHFLLGAVPFDTPGDDHIVGTADADELDASQGGNDFVEGLAGDDSIDFGATLTRLDRVDGGDDFDTLTITGDYSSGLRFRDSTMQNVESMVLLGVLNGGFSYSIRLTDANILPSDDVFQVVANTGAGQTVIFNDRSETDASVFYTGQTENDIVRLGDGDDTIRMGTGTNFADGGDGVDFASHVTINASLTIDLSLRGAQNIGGGVTETLRHIEQISGSNVGNDTLLGNKGDNFLSGNGGNDTLAGRGGNDVINGNIGTDVMVGGGGNDRYQFGVGHSAAQDSTGAAFDTIEGFNAGRDMIELPALPAAVDAAIAGGPLSDESFDSDLAAIVTPEKLAAHDAVLVTPDAGDHVGQLFLVVDVDGNAGYTGGSDMVVRLTDAHQMAHFGVGAFVSIGG